MDNWISITTPPKSGHHVLFYWINQYGMKRISKGYYAHKYEVVYEGDEFYEYMDYSEEKDEYYEKEGWYENGWELEYSAQIENVLLWHELPALPELHTESEPNAWDLPMDN